MTSLPSINMGWQKGIVNIAGDVQQRGE